MRTECSAERFEFGEAAGRVVVARFDGEAITSDAGALLLDATDRTIRLTERFAGRFTDRRRPELVEHEVGTLVMQRVVGIALGHEDLVDHDQLRHDPVLATLAGKLEARRTGCAPLAGKSTRNRAVRKQPDTIGSVTIRPPSRRGSLICSSRPIASHRRRSRSISQQEGYLPRISGAVRLVFASRWNNGRCSGSMGAPFHTKDTGPN